MDYTAVLLFSSFLIVGSFIIGFLSGWFASKVFDAWYDKADYAKQVIHPEMYDEDGEPTAVGDLLYLRIDKDDDILYDEDDD
ncbi:hypothetical protein SWPG_00124 [Synechococcus phage S-CBM2]|nr:hypothetical protein SWPG_00124 [Synechococcus phage S-CBM2]